MVLGVALGADYLVVHPGSCCGRTPGRGKTPAQAIRDVGQALRQAARGVRLCQKFGDLRDCHLRVLLENTSGMGAAMGSRFEELKAIMDAAPELPLGICLDTAHAFHAGYDIRSEAGLAQTIAALDRTVGLSRVAVLHVNDSKTPFASRVDRHEHIGRGKIGLEAFRRILNHPSLSSAGRTGSGGKEARETANENGKYNSSGGCPGRAFLLETPIDAPGDDRRNVRRLWDLVGITVKQAPRAQNGFSMLTRKRRTAPLPEPNRKSAKPTIRSGSSSRANNMSEGPLRSFRRTKKSRSSKADASWPNTIPKPWKPSGGRNGTPSASSTPTLIPAARSIICWRCCRIPPARCTWATCAITPSATPWRVIGACAARTCCIPSAGTPSACPPKTPPSSAALRRAIGPTPIP